MDHEILARPKKSLLHNNLVPMFTRVLDTAKRILSRSPSVQGRSSQGRDTPPIIPLDSDNTEAMVTTRGGTETPGTAGATPRSSAKKKGEKRQLESQDTPSQAKRQRKSVPTAEEERESEGPEPPPSVENATQELEQQESESGPVTMPLNEDAGNMEGLPIRRRTNRNVVVKTTPKSEKAHVRFGSEEPAEVQSTFTSDQLIAGTGDDDYASDSSEAPEIIATAAATSKAKSAQQETERAFKAQEAKEEAKRQKREARIAEEQAQKRLREERKARKLAKRLAKGQDTITHPSHDDHADIPANPKAIPALLPDSLLNAIDDQRPPTPPPERRGKTAEERRKEKLNHHIKFLERSQKPIKHVKKGRLSVAILAKQSKVLPPKVNRDLKNCRESWLKGRIDGRRKGKKSTYKAGKVERRSHGLGGFLRGED